MNAEQLANLHRVGPGTETGALLRCYWHPVAVGSELPPGGTLAVRLLGEDFVLFRGEDGVPGLLAAACPHRGTTLVNGHVEGDALRCPYHGWLFDRGGACREVPYQDMSPESSAALDARAGHAAELGGLVFAYIGPTPAPLLPRFDLFVWEGVLRDAGRALLPCNWLQIMENSVDPTHVEWLHGHHLGRVRERAGQSGPKHYVRRHERIGFDRFEHGIVKRRILEGGSEEDDDWAVGHPLIFPCMLRVGAGLQHRFQIRVPVDDTHTLHWWYSVYRPAEGHPPPPAQDGLPVYEVPWQDERGRPLADFVDGGDIMTWLGQGPIADRASERLVGSDQGLLLLRRLLVEEREKVARGEDPLGVRRDPADDVVIELPQEQDKFGGGAGFLAESVAMSHVRYSPLRERILALLTGS